ncbi:MAG: cytochrome c [Verrucomicrobiaceae bacterium]|nr:MAG: cytochrome c [Verrucomicrobiaceae bacterium]
MKPITTALLIVGSLICAASLASAADAAENWGKLCASCHAKDGSGSTVMGKKNNVEDYRSAAVQAKFTDAQAIQIITDGKDKMKSFKEKLTPDEIKALVAYIRGMKK